MKKLLIKNIRGKFLSAIYKRYVTLYLKLKSFPLRHLNFSPKDKILVLTPHPDDESIGCGGLLLNYASQCDVLLLTDGCMGDPSMTNLEVMSIRKREFETAMNYAGVNSFQILNIEDGSLSSNYETFTKCFKKQYDFIFVPNFLDQHADHASVSFHLKQFFSLNKTSKNVQIYLYEVWNALPIPNRYLDISTIYEKKKNLISIYQSQVKFINYPEKILSLNYFRGMAVNADYAECYTQLSIKDFMTLIK